MSAKTEAMEQICLMRSLLSQVMTDLIAGNVQPSTADTLAGARDQLAANLRWALYANHEEVL